MPVSGKTRMKFIDALFRSLICIISFIGCDDSNTSSKFYGHDHSANIPSLSNKYMLKIDGFTEQSHDATWWHAKISIFTEDGQKVYEDNNGFAAWFTLRFGWDEEDRVWCYSGDIGIYYWKNTPQGWCRSQWKAESGYKIPRFLGISKDELQQRYKRGF
jgi:hypothetical protein